MSIQTEEYINDMKEMYIKILSKTVLTADEIMFLDIYKRTLGNIGVFYE
jgi:hypothetical protein